MLTAKGHVRVAARSTTLSERAKKTACGGTPDKHAKTWRSCGRAAVAPSVLRLERGSDCDEDYTGGGAAATSADGGNEAG